MPWPLLSAMLAAWLLWRPAPQPPLRTGWCHDRSHLRGHPRLPILQEMHRREM